MDCKGRNGIFCAGDAKQRNFRKDRHNGIFYLKLYNATDDEIKKYELAEKVTLNKKKKKASEVINDDLLYDSANQSVIHQLIKFQVDENDKIKTIMTADAYKDEFAMYQGQVGGKRLQYRQNIKCLIDGTTPLFYLNNSIYINVPKEDFENEDCYYKRSFKNDEYYYMNLIYKDDIDSPVAKVVIQQSDSGAGNKVDLGKPLSILVKMNEIEYDGGMAYKIKGVNYNGNFEAIVCDEKLMKVVKNLDRGDLFRYDSKAKTGEVKSIEKVYDASERKIVGINEVVGVNPYGSDDNNNFVSNLHVLHGEVQTLPDKGKYMTVAPYQYSTQEGSEGEKEVVVCNE